MKKALPLVSEPQGLCWPAKERNPELSEAKNYVLCTTLPLSYHFPATCSNKDICVWKCFSPATVSGITWQHWVATWCHRLSLLELTWTESCWLLQWGRTDSPEQGKHQPWFIRQNATQSIRGSFPESQTDPILHVQIKHWLQVKF